MKGIYKRTMHACYMGYITQAIVNNLTPLLFVIFQGSFGLSFEQVGRLALINFGVQILADVFCVKYVDKLGYRRSAVLAHLLCVLGLASLAILPRLMPDAYLGLIISVVIYAWGGGLLEVIVSPIVESLPTENKKSAMSLLHSFYCWGQVVVVLFSTLFLQAAGGGMWFLLPLIWAIVPLYNLLCFLKVPLMPPVKGKKLMTLSELFRSRAFVLALVLMLCAGASELSMSQWSSLFAEDGLKAPKMLGDLLGPCLFAVFMGLGRTLYSHFGAKIDLKKALFFCAMLCVACYAVTVFAPWPILSLLGCALCGLSVSLMWPGTFSLSAERFPCGGTAMFGMFAVFGDLGGSLGPWLTGYVSDKAQDMPALVQLFPVSGMDPAQLGIKCGLLVAAAFPAIMLFCVLAFQSGKKKLRGGVRKT